MTDFALVCRTCGREVAAREYLAAAPAPDDEICLECERRQQPECIVCRMGWLVANRNFEFVCPDCA